MALNQVTYWRNKKETRKGINLMLDFFCFLSPDKTLDLYDISSNRTMNLLPVSGMWMAFRHPNHIQVRNFFSFKKFLNKYKQ